ncbi:hypothetical protein EPO04_01465 [Patescibacteria group bacterium]|nr:MAG: hypothetical protein EPO04_01465 [Patescibacteria group bacterium]
MHIKIPKHHRTKKAKIAFLKRSAAAKSHHHRKRHKKLALQHAFVLGLLGLVTLATTGVVAAMADNLIPPPSKPIDMTPYIEAAKAEREAQKARNAAVIESAPDQSGIASWYALGLRAPDALTCASTKFPRGTYLKVKNLRNGAQVTCLVNDYGPQPGTKRVIDLSRGSFTKIGSLGSGTLPVEIRVVPGP